MSRKHGITTNTYKKFAVDSGAVYKNYGEGSEALLGATRGGNTFSIETEYRTMEVDGAHGPVKGDKRIIGVNAKITANFLELDYNILQLALSGATATDNTTYYTMTRALEIALADYVTNIAIVGEFSGSDTVPFVGIVKNALATSGFEMTFADKEESALSVEFLAHFDVSALDTEPWEIRVPVIS